MQQELELRQIEIQINKPEIQKRRYMYCLHGSSGTKLCTTKLFKHPIKKMAEVVISPDYYCRGKTEVWDFIREQGLNYHLGNW